MRQRMHGVWIGHEEDRVRLRLAALYSGRHDWRIDTVDTNVVYLKTEILDLLSRDFIFLPLSLPGYWSLRLPELANQVGAQVRLILCSRTDADRNALARLFDGAFTPQSLMADLLARAERPSTRERDPGTTASLIDRIIETSSVLKTSLNGARPTVTEVREYQFPRLGSVRPEVPGSLAPEKDLATISRATQLVQHNYFNHAHIGDNNSQTVSGSVGAAVAGHQASIIDHGSALTQQEHRAVLKDTQAALLHDQDDFDRLDSRMYEALSQFLRIAREIHVEQRSLADLQAQMKATLDEVWAKHITEQLKPRALPRTMEVAKAILENPIMAEVAKQLIAS